MKAQPVFNPEFSDIDAACKTISYMPNYELDTILNRNDASELKRLSELFTNKWCLYKLNLLDNILDEISSF